jgi:hypothetical protein
MFGGRLRQSFCLGGLLAALAGSRPLVPPRCALAAKLTLYCPALWCTSLYCRTPQTGKVYQEVASHVTVQPKSVAFGHPQPAVYEAPPQPAYEEPGGCLTIQAAVDGVEASYLAPVVAMLLKAQQKPLPPTWSLQHYCFPAMLPDPIFRPSCDLDLICACMHAAYTGSHQGVTVTTTGPLAVPNSTSVTPLETGAAIGGAVAATSAVSPRSGHHSHGIDTTSTATAGEGLLVVSPIMRKLGTRSKRAESVRMATFQHWLHMVW